MPKLLAISHSTFDPVSRFPVVQLLPYFRDAGWSATHRPFWPSLYWQSPFGNQRFDRAACIAAHMLRRSHMLLACARAGRYDVVLVNRELPIGAELLLERNPRLIFDFDDALHLGLMPDHVAFMCREAACIVAGNETLAAEARKHSSRVRVVPTLVDTDSYSVKKPDAFGPVVRVAWLGSDLSIRETLLPHLDILARAQKATPFQLVVISRPRPTITHPTLDWTFVEWSSDVERRVSEHAEIGIMPLQDTPWQRAKCALKLLEYMAAGLPAIASPVGISAEILQRSGAGRAASTSEDWTSALAELCADPDLRARLGTRGRTYCVEHFKEESELEVWKQDASGRFALLRTYPICRWSGQLGPKIKEGDRQAPEGFYTITPGQMNPNSNYYLAINTGYPNTYDRANGRTGAFLMIHGDCASVGCYAMTDEQISEIYALARESFFGGQKSFQLEAFPFRMTPLNMARHRNSLHMAFWKMLKQGYDHFEVTHLEPRVDVCEKRYVFDAETTDRFSPVDRCPAYKVREDIAAAVHEKQRRDDIQTAQLISSGTPIVTMGTDGGMNSTFLAAVKMHGGAGATIRTAAGTIPAHANPPAEPRETTTGSFVGLTSSESRPTPQVQVGSAGSTDGIGSLVGNLFGSKSEGQAPAARNTPSVQTSAPKTKPATAMPEHPAVAAAGAIPRPQPANTKIASALLSKPPSTPPKRQTSAEPQSTPVLLSGAAPTIPAGSFDNRFGPWR